MNTDAVQCFLQPRDIDCAVQQTASFEAEVGDILIVRMQDGETRQDGVAVVLEAAVARVSASNSL